MRSTALGTLALGGALASCGFDWSLPVPAPSNGGGGTGTTGDATSIATGASTAVASSGANNQACTACAMSAISGQCSGDWATCQQTVGCVQIADCAIACGGNPGCITGCEANASNQAKAAFDTLVNCVLCTVCLSQCRDYAASCA